MDGFGLKKGKRRIATADERVAVTAVGVCVWASGSSVLPLPPRFVLLSFERPCVWISALIHTGLVHHCLALPLDRRGRCRLADDRGVLNRGALSTHLRSANNRRNRSLVHASSPHKQATAVLPPPHIHTDEAYEAQQQHHHQERQPDRPCASPPTSCWCVSFACESPCPGLGGGLYAFAALCAVLLRLTVASLFSPQRDHPSSSLQHARAFINPVKDRELDLRGACAFARIDHHQPRSLARTPRHD